MYHVQQEQRSVSYTHLDVYKRQEITPFDLIEVGDNINKTQGIAKGFRKIQVDIKKADFFPITSYMVPQACLLYTSRCV